MPQIFFGVAVQAAGTAVFALLGYPAALSGFSQLLFGGWSLAAWVVAAVFTRYYSRFFSGVILHALVAGLMVVTGGIVLEPFTLLACGAIYALIALSLQLALPSLEPLAAD